ncbi:hypothetical protein HZQ13_15275 [Elizabethkingia anophelis]|nr:hypothetical protein [Elizabethkingia anophelis]
MNTKKSTVIVNGKEIELTHYLEKLTKEPNNSNYHTKIELTSYQDIGFLQNSILSVCRQALESGDQYADGLDFARMLELAQSLIPHSEFELLSILHDSSRVKQ